MGAFKTVLVVDDDADIRTGVARLLLNDGYDVYTVADGGEALNEIHQWGWVDLVILDLMMPKVNGYEALTRLRNSGYKDIAVIILTAKSEPRDVAAGYNKGADLYLTKPFNPQVLLHAVRYLIGNPSAEERERLEMLLLSAGEVFLCVKDSVDR